MSRNSYIPIIDRRTTLKWMLSTGASMSMVGLVSPSQADEEGTIEATHGIVKSYFGQPKPISGRPYGNDPSMMKPEVTWDLTMSKKQLQLVAALSDTILPADDELPSGSELGVPDFINEWMSSPYDKTLHDRAKCFQLFGWLEAQALQRFNQPFADLENIQREQILDDIAYKKNVTKGMSAEASAFARFRFLAVSAYFASPVGAKWLGYIGNIPISGPYPGPSEEALAHLSDILKKRGLTMPKDT